MRISRQWRITVTGRAPRSLSPPSNHTHTCKSHDIMKLRDFDKVGSRYNLLSYFVKKKYLFPTHNFISSCYAKLFMQKEFTPVMRYIVVSLSKIKTYLVTSYKNCFNKVMSWEKNSFPHQVRGKTWPSVYHSISKSINIADLLLPTFKLPFPVQAGSAFSHSLPQAVLF